MTVAVAYGIIKGQCNGKEQDISSDEVVETREAAVPLSGW
jgi:hypothetical protein